MSHSVAEVESVAHRLQREVDTKREELRVMVGERYRYEGVLLIKIVDNAQMNTMRKTDVAKSQLSYKLMTQKLSSDYFYFLSINF